MGKGGLNRLLLSATDLTATSEINLPADDIRATHIRTILSQSFSPHSAPPTLRIAVEHAFLHNEAPITLQKDGAVSITIPTHGRIALGDRPPVRLVIAMQRPKVMARVITAAACIGVHSIWIVAADKVEKSYWDCRLLRPAPEDPTMSPQRSVPDAADLPDGWVPLPGRPRGPGKHPARDKAEEGVVGGDAGMPAVRIEDRPQIRKRLLEGIEQACVDAVLPHVYLERRGIEALLRQAEIFSEDCVKLVAHPDRRGGLVTECEKGRGERAVVLAIGAEGGWTEEEILKLTEGGFEMVQFGERVLRSEMAVVVGLGLVHELLRGWESAQM